MSAKREAQIELLAGVDLFYGCFRRELARIAALTSELQVPTGHVLFRQGDAGDAAYVIVEGTAVVAMGEHKVAVLRPGDFFGELALLDGGPRLAGVTATSPMRLLELKRRAFHAVLGDVPYVAGHMITVLGARLRLAEGQLYRAAAG
jgi:CRP/FNR family cyclic AMP-dependent transcriptional regulator